MTSRSKGSAWSPAHRSRANDDRSGSQAPPKPEGQDLEHLLARLDELLKKLAHAEDEYGDLIRSLPEDRQASAINLIHYLTFRSEDLRGLQDALTRLGLSSLGRAESHVLWNLQTVAGRIGRELGRTTKETSTADDAITPDLAWERLSSNTRQLLGPPPAKRATRIMVTMPSEAATDYALVRELVAAGMDCMRINCAHDGQDAWGSMIRHLRDAERELGRSCRLLMDLPGPRLRTGPIEPGPEVVQIEPDFDDFGRVTEAAQVWLTPTESPEVAPGNQDGILPLPARFLEKLQLDDEVLFIDAAGIDQTLIVKGIEGRSRWAQLNHTAHVTSGTEVRLLPAARQEGPSASARVGAIPGRKQKISLQAGDPLILHPGPVPGAPARTDPVSGERVPARIGCLPAEALDHVQPGERIWFDDGRIGGVIRSVGDEIRVEITRTRPGGDKLKPEKGINLPDTDLGLPALTADDLAILPFIAEHADLVGYSFVATPQDVRELRTALEEIGDGDLGIMLKIERETAFEQLPRLLLEGMRSPAMGVMIARGDLAVECGFARMAEVQEEILWLCAAAHVPVIWATQVMEQLAKLGRPSRAEVTDAAMGGRAECVMLNKGPHIPDAVKALISILDRMQEHQQKKRSMLRRLEVASHFFTAQPPDHRVDGDR